MNKAILALRISERLGIQKKTAEDFISAFQDAVTDALKRDDEVTIAGFGTFSSRVRAARKGVNPRKPNEIINVPAVKIPKFKAGKKLKDELKASTPGAAPATAQEVKKTEESSSPTAE